MERSTTDQNTHHLHQKGIRYRLVATRRAARCNRLQNNNGLIIQSLNAEVNQALGRRNGVIRRTKEQQLDSLPEDKRQKAN